VILFGAFVFGVNLALRGNASKGHTCKSSKFAR